MPSGRTRTALAPGKSSKGPTTTDEAGKASVDAAWEAGILYFDTAPHYGAGMSEHRFGAALRARPRDEYTLSTKVGRLLHP